MAGSFANFDGVVAASIDFLKPSTLLDVGSGSGKYGRMLRNARGDDCHAVGVEIETSYIERFQLHSLYDEVWTADIFARLRSEPERNFDIAILGDCIEHMPKSYGLDLLNLLAYRTRYTFVISPEFYVQGAEDGIASQAHISVWSEADFAWHDRWAWDNCMMISMTILRGYLASGITFDELIDAINRTEVPIYKINADQVARPAYFRKQVRERHEHADGKRLRFRHA